MTLPWYELLLRLSLAVVFGLCIGLEREHRHRPAGVKTHMLVCVGAALVSLIQIKMLEETIRLVTGNPELANVIKTDIGRLGAQVISGVGFLGAGTILRTRGTIRGLTTAATLWLTACIGLAVGMGYYLMSILTVALTMTVLICLQLFQSGALLGRSVRRLMITVSSKREAMDFLNDYCASRHIQIVKIEQQALHDLQDGANELPAAAQTGWTYLYTIRLPRSVTADSLLVDWQMNEAIVSANWDSDSFLE